MAIKEEDRGQNRAGHVQVGCGWVDAMESFGGVMFPGGLHTQESLRLALSFPFQETDILIVSYPKSGKDSERCPQA